MADNYIQGDHNVTDDVTGRKIKASDARKQWDGKIVHKDVWEPRHPQDLIRSRRDMMAVKDPRPEPVATFVGPLTTTLAAAASPGDTSLTVTDSSRMEPGDYVNIMLDDGENCRRLIQSVPDAATVVLLSGISGRASIGNQIVDNSAMAPATLP